MRRAIWVGIGKTEQMIVLGDSQVRYLRIELLNIRKFKTRKRVVMCYPGAEI